MEHLEQAVGAQGAETLLALVDYVQNVADDHNCRIVDNSQFDTQTINKTV